MSGLIVAARRWPWLVATFAALVIVGALYLAWPRTQDVRFSGESATVELDGRCFNTSAQAFGSTWYGWGGPGPTAGNTFEGTLRRQSSDVAMLVPEPGAAWSPFTMHRLLPHHFLDTGCNIR
jgi:hypothetical protein